MGYPQFQYQAPPPRKSGIGNISDVLQGLVHNVMLVRQMQQRQQAQEQEQATARIRQQILEARLRGLNAPPAPTQQTPNVIYDQTTGTFRLEQGSMLPSSGPQQGQQQGQSSGGGFSGMPAWMLPNPADKQGMDPGMQFDTGREFWPSRTTEARRRENYVEGPTAGVGEQPQMWAPQPGLDRTMLKSQPQMTNSPTGNKIVLTPEQGRIVAQMFAATRSNQPGPAAAPKPAATPKPPADKTDIMYRFLEGMTTGELGAELAGTDPERYAVLVKQRDALAKKLFPGVDSGTPEEQPDQTGMVIIESGGVRYKIPASNLEAARKRDKNLKVIGR